MPFIVLNSSQRDGGDAIPGFRRASAASSYWRRVEVSIPMRRASKAHLPAEVRGIWHRALVPTQPDRAQNATRLPRLPGNLVPGGWI